MGQGDEKSGINLFLCSECITFAFNEADSSHIADVCGVLPVRVPRESLV